MASSFACMSHDVVKVVLERMYNTLVKIFGDCSAATIPRYKKVFFKILVDPKTWTIEAGICNICQNMEGRRQTQSWANIFKI